MSKTSKIATTKKKTPKKSEVNPSATLGRKRDPALDESILEAAIETLAEMSFDTMTMDMVAARAKAGKATVYRRWPSKAELVRDAIIFMSRNSVATDKIPDTGTLRGDLLSLLKPTSLEYSQRKLRILAGLGSFFQNHKKIAQEASAGIFGPWTEMNRTLMKRAIERGDLAPNANIDLACEIIAAMTAYYTQVQAKHFDKGSYEQLLDQILLPALRNPKKTAK